MKIFNKDCYVFLMITRVFLWVVELILLLAFLLAVALHIVPTVAVEFSAYNGITYASPVLDVVIGTLLPCLFFLSILVGLFVIAVKKVHSLNNKFYSFIEKKYIAKLNEPRSVSSKKGRFKRHGKKKGAVKIETDSE